MPRNALNLPAESSDERCDSPLLNVVHAASLLQIEVCTLYKYTSQRMIPHYKRAGKLFFDRAELLAWVQEGRRPVIDSSKATAHLSAKRGGK
jgi:predicted DNA-binding transcriptional regulator AlpA